MLKILKHDETVIFRIMGSNSAYIMNDKLKYMPSVKVSNSGIAYVTKYAPVATFC